MSDAVTRACAVCHGSFTPRRSDAVTCSARCRKARSRGAGYVVTDEDRAAIDRVWARHPCPLPELTPEQVRAHVLATARYA